MTTTLTRPCRTCALHVAPGEPHDGGAGNSWREPGKGVGMTEKECMTHHPEAAAAWLVALFLAEVLAAGLLRLAWMW
jgi:hypothetical protein